MAAQITVYTHACEQLARGRVHWEHDVIKLALLNPLHRPRYSDHEFYSDVMRDEIPDGRNYLFGGVELTGRKVATQFRQTCFYADPLTIPDFKPAQPFQHGAIYCLRALPEESPLLAGIDFGYIQDPNGLPFAIEWAPTGVLSIDGIELPQLTTPREPVIPEVVSVIDRLIEEIREQRAA